MIMKNLLKLSLALLVVACSQPKSNNESESTEVKEPVEDKISLEVIWESDTVLTTSESVYYDKSNDVLYVSCINGVPPNAQDEDGYIAKVSPKDGSIIELKWITGLDAPKGMGKVGNNLYVTNIDELVIVDITTGEITERVAVPEAQFLNDIATDDDGNVYFSDSNTNKLHKYSADGTLSTWLEGENLGGPNGLFHDGERMMLATFGAGDFRSIDYTTEEVKPVVDSIPGGDGVVKVGVDYLVSNWNGEVYYVTSDWEKQLILDTKEIGANAADIEFDESSMTLYVPTFFGNQVAAYKLNK